jgi:hypothetical protein
MAAKVIKKWAGSRFLSFFNPDDNPNFLKTFQAFEVTLFTQRKRITISFVFHLT